MVGIDIDGNDVTAVSEAASGQQWRAHVPATARRWWSARRTVTRATHGTMILAGIGQKRRGFAVMACSEIRSSGLR